MADLIGHLEPHPSVMADLIGHLVDERISYCSIVFG